MDKKISDRIHTNFEEALAKFDFQKVYTVMHHLGWTWHMEQRPPDEFEMEEKVIELFEEGMGYFRNETVSIGSGGFEVTIYSRGRVRIEFVVEQTSSIN